MNRGEIYYISRDEQRGAMLHPSGRPAVIVTRQNLALTSPVQQVVFLTTRERNPMPSHVTVDATGRTSTAICEQVTSVPVESIGKRCGVCSDEEMRQIDDALAWALGLAPEQDYLEGPTEEPDGYTDDDAETAALLLIAETQRDLYRQLYEGLLARVTRGVDA